MKALSGYAEWFYCMAKNWKNVENRPRPLWREIATQLPVRIYLHASKNDHVQRSRQEWDFIIEHLTPEQRVEFCSVDWDKYRGHIIGEITIYRQMRKREYREADHVDIGSQQKELEILIAEKDPSVSPWFLGLFGYAVKDGVLYSDPIPCKGKLGFFEPEMTPILQ